MLSDRVGGIISIIFGSIAMSEAIRLFPARMDTFVGDHTMPGIVGGALILLGLLLVFFVKGESFKVEFPDRVIMKSMLLALGLLFAYWFAIQYLGYVISTLLVSIGLFKVLGFFSLAKSAIYATILTTIFYFLFIFWLGMPFPTGIFNI
ncbi:MULTISPECIES: tripartite tricarboxylate transporter TctB family protein [Paenibacillus]|uniref:Tripartite tricarboxylate transporter family receptor n=1 Tax=Paenibacillus naphthalenovorans TaxID=162209 RepID=A0A0U2KYQ5_9BACL|nr:MULTISPECIES: tripartite tricarboxylate transporter TctB family protein [Paenibacillus]ALS22066.1 tripartite tricarboxylate transporter family receptor [Paenibacillus naphthalenovorans]NTZ16795.1 tripartite tricarboxylate transporter TctB family protein [Paenibacillus sp. JMULE4]GCL70115.1 tripartite tricarboxylate transporter TctB family protein [Paenibacillus naphthalenovorans]SDJ56825.1 Tripartite tricarboxylate transporter TctB family protein [Paenibacillus naphthalenovorans]